MRSMSQARNNITSEEGPRRRIELESAIIVEFVDT